MTCPRRCLATQPTNACCCCCCPSLHLEPLASPARLRPPPPTPGALQLEPLEDKQNTFCSVSGFGTTCPRRCPAQPTTACCRPSLEPLLPRHLEPLSSRQQEPPDEQHRAPRGSPARLLCRSAGTSISSANDHVVHDLQSVDVDRARDFSFGVHHLYRCQGHCFLTSRLHGHCVQRVIVRGWITLT